MSPPYSLCVKPTKQSTLLFSVQKATYYQFLKAWLLYDPWVLLHLTPIFRVHTLILPLLLYLAGPLAFFRPFQ